MTLWAWALCLSCSNQVREVLSSKASDLVVDGEEITALKKANLIWGFNLIFEDINKASHSAYSCALSRAPI